MRTSLIIMTVIVAVLLLAGCPPRAVAPETPDTVGTSVVSPWQFVTDTSLPKRGHCETVRMPVPGGWMYRSIAHCGDGVSVTQIFVPDANGQVAEVPPQGSE